MASTFFRSQGPMTTCLYHRLSTNTVLVSVQLNPRPYTPNPHSYQDSDLLFLVLPFLSMPNARPASVSASLFHQRHNNSPANNNPKPRVCSEWLSGNAPKQLLLNVEVLYYMPWHYKKKAANPKVTAQEQLGTRFF